MINFKIKNTSIDDICKITDQWKIEAKQIVETDSYTKNDSLDTALEIIENYQNDPMLRDFDAAVCYKETTAQTIAIYSRCEKEIELFYLFTRPQDLVSLTSEGRIKGGGTACVNLLKKIAIYSNLPLKTSPTRCSETFYTKMGFKPEDQRHLVYRWKTEKPEKQLKIRKAPLKSILNKNIQKRVPEINPYQPRNPQSIAYPI